MQLCSKPRGAPGIEPETFRRRGQKKGWCVRAVNGRLSLLTAPADPEASWPLVYLQPSNPTREYDCTTIRRKSGWVQCTLCNVHAHIICEADAAVGSCGSVDTGEDMRVRLRAGHPARLQRLHAQRRAIDS